MALVEVEKAAFKYGEQEIFKDINLELGNGEVFCLFGPNGCGKSTLLECVLGILKLKEGQININNKPVNKMKPHELAKYMAYVPQIHEKKFPYKVKDIVLMGRAAYTGAFSSPAKKDIEIAENAMDILGLNDLKNKPYTQLSGGETQLVMMARALAQETPIIVMDEPTAHLDFRHELTILETIVKIVNEKNLTILMATHFPNHAFYFENNKLPTSVALMNDQTLKVIGPPSEVLTEENMRLTFSIKSKMVNYRNDENVIVNHLIPINTII